MHGEQASSPPSLATLLTEIRGYADALDEALTRAEEAAKPDHDTLTIARRISGWPRDQKT